jgi:hypothetical protein
LRLGLGADKMISSELAMVPRLEGVTEPPTHRTDSRECASAKSFDRAFRLCCPIYHTPTLPPEWSSRFPLPLGRIAISLLGLCSAGLQTGTSPHRPVSIMAVATYYQSLSCTTFCEAWRFSFSFMPVKGDVVCLADRPWRSSK